MHRDPDPSEVINPAHGQNEALEQRTQPATFGQRHGLKVMATVMAIMFATVIVAQVGC